MKFKIVVKGEKMCCAFGAANCWLRGSRHGKAVGNACYQQIFISLMTNSILCPNRKGFTANYVKPMQREYDVSMASGCCSLV